MWLKGNRLMAVKTCSKALSSLYVSHGKSPCFLQVNFLRLVSPDYQVSISPCLDETKTLECAL